MSKFQIALLGLFGFFILAAVLVFSLYKGSSLTRTAVVVWGSIPASQVSAALADPALSGDEPSITYVEKSPSRIQEDFTEALAQGKGPDLLILTQEEVWGAKGKLAPFPLGSVSARNFSDTFSEGGEAFFLPEGAYALPLAVDPLVLYYNRDILSSAGIAKPLAFWDEIYAQAAKIGKKDAAGNITETTIALGETRNIPNFKDVLSLLLLQAGSPVTALTNGELRSALRESAGLPVPPAESALDFYTQFANPSKPFYSWNRVMPDAQSAFAAGDVAYYVGFASELGAIRKKSPTLNFAVSAVPQSRVAGKTITFGKTYGVAVSRGTRSYEAAMTAAFKLASKGGASALAQALDLPPSRRDILAGQPEDPNDSVFYVAALQARSWLDPQGAGSKAAFAEALESITSGRARVSEALSLLSDRIESLANR